MGGAALASELWPDVDRYIPLVIGVGLLVADSFPGDEADGPGAVLGTGLGFVGIWVVSWLMRLKEHHFWPLVPGGILLLVGAGLVLDLFNADVSRWFIPAVVVVIGLLIMLLGYLRMSRPHGGQVA